MERLTVNQNVSGSSPDFPVRPLLFADLVIWLHPVILEVNGRNRLPTVLPQRLKRSVENELGTVNMDFR